MDDQKIILIAVVIGLVGLFLYLIYKPKASSFGQNYRDDPYQVCADFLRYDECKKCCQDMVSRYGGDYYKCRAHCKGGHIN